ncbi:MAG TPA: hypothetical protein VFH92_08675 [Phenylobacterium sp.]|nr:hypothetical protein [Phenylobacterium sp.]
MTYSSQDTPRQTTTVTRARQGRWGRHVFWVLVFSTLLAALGMFAAWAWKAETHPGPAGTGQETVSGRGMDTPAPPSPTLQTPPGQPAPR